MTTKTRLSAIKKAAIAELKTEFGKLLMRINHPDSGQILETAIQHLPAAQFNALARFISNGPDETSQSLTLGFALRIAQKLDLIGTIPEETMYDAARNIVTLIQYEGLRRMGHAEYVWPSDIFTSTPKNFGFIRLTETGKESFYRQILESYHGGKYLQ